MEVETKAEILEAAKHSALLANILKRNGHLTRKSGSGALTP
jgi:hypothetical protein